MFQAKNLSNLANVSHSFLGRNGDVKNVFLLNQVHGDSIYTLDSKCDPAIVRATNADALFTKEPGIWLGIRTADCAPLLIADNKGRGVMAVHLGWRGVACGLAQKSIAFFCDALKIEPNEVVCAIGPCIGYDAFEVQLDVVQALRAQVSEEGLVKRVDELHFLVDLGGWIEKILKGSGVENVEVMRRCTFRDRANFFSYRRDKGETGRQVSAIAIRSV